MVVDFFPAWAWSRPMIRGNSRSLDGYITQHTWLKSSKALHYSRKPDLIELSYGTTGPEEKVETSA